ncbi:MAG: acetyl-CoA hydrolase/transferase family protein [Ignavibacteriales bacterium]
MAKIARPVADPRGDYRKKLVAPEEAVKMVKSGDRIMYGEFVCVPVELDAALAKRKEELYDVWLYTNTLTFVPQVSLADPTHEHFLHNDLSFSVVGRKLSDAGLCFHVPCAYTGCYPGLRGYEDRPNVCFVAVGPMDDKGFFNFGPTSSLNPLMLEICDRIVVEINTNLPKVIGGAEYAIHISQVDAIVEGKNPQLLQVPKLEASENDEKIARNIMTELEDGICLQLGIGGMPNKVGELIAASDLKDIGVHTEMLVDSYVDIWDAGRITNQKKTIDRGKFTFTFAMGSDKVYNFVDQNPLCNIMPPTYTNEPSIIARNENVVSICSCLEVDLTGQVSSESIGPRQISGTGGQFDFIFGAFHSQGGKGFLCLNSTSTDKQGNLISRIVPGLSPSTVVTVPRWASQYIVTEYGVAKLKAKPTWARAEALINVAHPSLRDELIKHAEANKIWRYTNKQS